MNDIDKMIRDALAAEEAKMFEQVGGEQSLHEMIFETFRGKRRWLVVWVFLFSFIFLGLAVFAAIQFFQVESIREMILWACAFWYFMIVISMLKIWYWMELNKNSVTREVKRLELQLARLNQYLRQEADSATADENG